MTSDTSDDLFPHIRNPKGHHVINARCSLRTQNGCRMVLVSGMPLAQYAVGDRMSEALAMVNLVDQGWADQDDVAKAFGCSVRTVRRHERRFEEGGLPALGRSGGYPRGRARMPSPRQRSIQQLKAQGHSHNEIARRIGVTVRAVRKTLRRLGWKAETVVQPELPLALQASEKAKPSSRASVPVRRLGTGTGAGGRGGPKPVRFV